MAQEKIAARSRRGQRQQARRNADLDATIAYLEYVGPEVAEYDLIASFLLQTCIRLLEEKQRNVRLKTVALR